MIAHPAGAATATSQQASAAFSDAHIQLLVAHAPYYVVCGWQTLLFVA